VAIVKSQIHAGGRGKGTVYEKDVKTVRLQGGVKLVRSAAEAKDIASKILGYPLVTKQSGPHGRVVRRVYVEAGCDIDRELYLGAVLDRDRKSTRLNSSHLVISYAVFCLKKKKKN